MLLSFEEFAAPGQSRFDGESSVARVDRVEGSCGVLLYASMPSDILAPFLGHLFSMRMLQFLAHANVGLSRYITAPNRCLCYCSLTSQLRLLRKESVRDPLRGSRRIG